MDIITHPGAIARGIIIAEHGKFIEFAYRHLCDVGHKIVGDIVGILANASAFMRTYRIKITEQGDVPVLSGGIYIAQNFLNKQLGPSIGIGGGNREILSDWYLIRVAIDRSRRAEHNILHTVLAHNLAEVNGTGDVVMIVF